jgi:hypothetical protein
MAAPTSEIIFVASQDMMILGFLYGQDFCPLNKKRISSDLFEGYSTCKGNIFFLCSMKGQFLGYSGCRLVAIPGGQLWLLMLLKKGSEVKWILLFKIYHLQRNVEVNV